MQAIPYPQFQIVAVSLLNILSILSQAYEIHRKNPDDDTLAQTELKS